MTKKKVLYVGWLGFNNLGDELMWDIFRDICEKEVDLTRYSFSPSNKKVEKNDINGYDVIVLGGGSLIVPQFIDLLYHAMMQGKEIMIWGSGTDWIEKQKIIGLENNISNVKPIFGQNEGSKLKEIINYASYVGVRGPLTFSVLEHIGVNLQKVEESGDPGLLLHTNQTNSILQFEGWNTEDKIVGVNWGTSLNRIYGKDEEAVENQLVPAIKKLIAKGYKIVIYNVWKEDVKVNQRLYNKLKHSSNVKWLPNLYHHDELLSIMKHFEFTINFKLHANVISACAKVPFIALGYRFKVFDFAKSVGLSNMVISTDSNTIQQEISTLDAYIKNNKNQIIDQYEKNSLKYQNTLKNAIKKQFV